MKNMIALQAQNMMKADLGQTLKDLQNARPARPARPTDTHPTPFDLERPKEVRPNDPREPDRPDRRKDFDEVFSGHVQSQEPPPREPKAKPEAKTETKAKSDVEAQPHTKDTEKANGNPQGSKVEKETQTNKSGRKKSNAKAFQKVALNNDVLQKSANKLGDLGKNTNRLAEGMKTNQLKAEMLPLALAQTNKTAKASLSLENLNSTQLRNLGENLKKTHLKTAKGNLELANKPAASHNVQTIMMDSNHQQQKGAQTQQDANAQMNLQNSQNQPNQQNQQNQGAQANENFFQAEQALKNTAEVASKPTSKGVETSKANNQKFTIKNIHPLTKNAGTVTAKASATTASTGINKHFAKVQELMDPKVNVKINGHEANIRMATEKAGEIAVRLQMKQDGVADIRLATENPLAFDKKDELQAALQAEGLDLGQFNLGQDLEDQEDRENNENFEDDDVSATKTSTASKTPPRLKNGATMHVRA